MTCMWQQQYTPGASRIEQQINSLDLTCQPMKQTLTSNLLFLATNSRKPHSNLSPTEMKSSNLFAHMHYHPPAYSKKNPTTTQCHSR